MWLQLSSFEFWLFSSFMFPKRKKIQLSVLLYALFLAQIFRLQLNHILKRDTLLVTAAVYELIFAAEDGNIPATFQVILKSVIALNFSYNLCVELLIHRSHVQNYFYGTINHPMLLPTSIQILAIWSYVWLQVLFCSSSLLPTHTCSHYKSYLQMHTRWG